LIEWGIKKWVITKLASASSFEKVLAQMSHGQQYIILIETPKLYVELQKFLDKYSTEISAIGLGSHDFMISIGAQNNLEILKL